MTQDMTVLQSEITIPADPEPVSLRLALVGSLLVGGVLGYILTLVIFQDAVVCSPLALIVAVFVGAGTMQLAETYLKPRWNSHTYLKLSPQQLNIIKREKPVQVIDPTNQPRLHLWRFEVKRAGRVPKGWFMVGLCVEVNDVYLPVYALISPEQLEALPYGEHFTMLMSRDEVKRAGDDVMRLSGVQRRLLKAETARDVHGVEIEHDNLVIYLDWIKVHFPEWLPTA